MAHLWRGVIHEYADRLPSLAGAPIVTLGEGGTPLIRAAYISALVGAEVFVKFEGVNPTGSFKDRGMTTAISVAARHGAKAVICASTGNTSASAAAYATKAGMTCGVLVPDGKIAMGKLSQAIAHGATLLQVDGNFDDCLTLARKLAEAYPVELVNSVNPARIEGQKTASFEIVDVLGDAPDIHCLPVGNAGNITAYWRGYREYHRDSEQPGPQRPGVGGQPLRVLPRPQQRLLHDILGLPPVADQPGRIGQQGRSMLGVDSANEIGVWIVAGRGSGRVGLFAHTDCHGPTRLFVHCRDEPDGPDRRDVRHERRPQLPLA